MKAVKPPSPPENSFWNRLPAAHKKRIWIVLAAYLACMIALSGIVLFKATPTREAWLNRIPHASLNLSSSPQSDEQTAASLAAPQLQETSPEAYSIPEDTEDTPLVVPADARKAAYISIIVTNAGISASQTEKAFADLPVDMAFAFSPYSENLAEWIKKSGIAKRDMLLLLPMEPFNYPKDDPGPQTLLTRLGMHENEENLKKILARVPDNAIIGVMNHMGGRFLGDPKSLLPVFSALMAKNLYFVEMGEKDIPQATSTAAIAGISYTAADVKIDRDMLTEASLKQKLADLEMIAQAKGSAIGVAETYPLTVRVLKDWANSLDSRGIRLVPLTTTFKERSRQETDEQPQEQQQPAP